MTDSATASSPPSQRSKEAADQPTVGEVLAAAVRSLGGSDRPGQIQMADAVEQAISSQEHLLVQAGTGTGKSLAYLVPALLHADRTNAPVIVATATLALQAQLVDRDLPALADAVEPILGRRPTWATVKGRANYACLHRVRDGVPDDDGDGLIPIDEVDLGPLAADVIRARHWAEEQATKGEVGDRDRLVPGVSDRAWGQVSVTPRECLGAARCPYGTECFVERSRADAGDVDIVVTNHAFLAIDAIEGMSMLPEHDVVVIDEAHELAARVTNVATDQLWPGSVERAATRSRAHVDTDVAEDLRAASDALRDAMADSEVGRLDELPEVLAQALERVRDAAREVRSGFTSSAKEDRSPDVEAARRAAKALVDETFLTTERIVAGDDHDVVWLEERLRGGRVLNVAPISVAGLLRDRLFGEVTVVGTSATLELGGSFDAAASSFGLTGESAPSWQGLDVGSPFDYGRQAILYVARDLPTPGRDGPQSAMIDRLAGLLSASDGRALCLFSSRRSAEEAAGQIRARLPNLKIYCQGDDVMATLLRDFAADEQSCLFGTLSLWQGVDVAGPACQLVTVDRIPFPRPDDPLMSARQRAVERAGGNGFMSVAATHAALLLAQGTGRLIRRSTDRGVVAILDPRLVTARYAAYLRSSLPPMWFTSDHDVVEGALRRLSGQGTVVDSGA